MAAATKLGLEECLHDLPIDLIGHKPARNGDDVGVVMLAGELGKLGTCHISRANAVYFVGRNGHADARAAYKHAAVGQTVNYLAGNYGCIIRIVDAIVIVGTAVHDIASQFTQIVDEQAFLFEARMIACNTYTHGDTHLRSC